MTRVGLLALALVVGCIPVGQLGTREPHLVDRSLVGNARFEPWDIDLTVAVLEPSTVLVTAIAHECVYSLVQHVSRGNGRARRVPSGHVEVPCQVPAAEVPVRLTFASGETSDAITDHTGAAVFLTAEDPQELAAIHASIVGSAPSPAFARSYSAPTEPNGVSVPGAGTSAEVALPASTAPSKSKSAFGPVRDALVECGRRYHVTGTVKATLHLAAAATISTVMIDGGPFETCVRNKLRGVQLPIARPPGELVFPYMLR